MADEVSFGTALRRGRLAAGLSLAAMSRAVNYSKGYLSKVETGVSPPTPWLARRCDQVLGLGGALADLVPADSPGPAERVAPAGTVWMMGLGNSGSWYAPMEAHEAAALAATPAMAFRIAADTVPSAVARDSVESGFSAVFGHLRSVGRATLPGTVLPMLVSQVQVIRTLAEGASGPAATRLTALSARCAEYAGWMAQEDGDDRAARWWTALSVELAERAGDLDLVGYGLVREAEIRLYREDADGTVELAARAGSLPGVLPRTRALAAHREAQGHAMAGRIGACAAALDRARAQWAESAGAARGDAPLGATTVTDLGAMVEGWCAYELGAPQDAIDLLHLGLSGTPEDSLRIRGLIGMRLALAYEAVGELDEMERFARTALAAVPTVRSATVLSQLRLLSRALGRHTGKSAAAELRADIAQTVARLRRED
ncbi:helix-turn-helix domain-containing protein [Actinokineospora iranica]|uniref:Helix-turn-helix domain-containing protein n=1 Tax=Actinokineospora iranica TaxID=1271860 RepID=A0A1G6LFB6_9PSEU|nr:helix-turn-helix transcriptional regulator [Actinokineospora iranica]SDC41657.1 Helix-turn-helix domain-containing protein [Actinokineospora iranica]